MCLHTRAHTHARSHALTSTCASPCPCDVHGHDSHRASSWSLTAELVASSPSHSSLPSLRKKADSHFSRCVICMVSSLYLTDLSHAGQKWPSPGSRQPPWLWPQPAPRTPRSLADQASSPLGTSVTARFACLNLRAFHYVAVSS